MAVIAGALCQKKVREGPGGVKVDSMEETEVTWVEHRGDICTVGTTNNSVMTHELCFY